MEARLHTNDGAGTAAAFHLSPEQVRYFETFGFLKLPQLFEPEVDGISDGFEAVFRNTGHERMETYHAIHGDQRRITIPSFVDKDPRVHRLRDDDRVRGIAGSLIGDSYEYAESDGSVFYCGTAWHADIYGAPMSQYHVKLYFYLDALSSDTGAVRMMPGTNHFSETYASTLRADLEDPGNTRSAYGVDGAELPSFTLPTDPGDVIVGNYRTLHASFGGVDRRRLFTISFRAPRSS